MEAKLQIRSKSIIGYNQKTGKPLPRTEMQLENAKKFIEEETYTGKMTFGAKKRLTKAVENLAMLAAPKSHTFKHKKTGQIKTFVYNLNFITLTLADNEIFYDSSEVQKSCFEPFLLWLHRKHGVKLYLWKAELQKRGQLHYHITTDTYIPHDEIKDKWNQLQKNAGYLESHYKKFGHYNPNGTDVHAVYKQKNIAGYLKKKVMCEFYKREKLSKNGILGEYTKDIQNKETVGGKVWDCCQVLKSKVAAYYLSQDTATIPRLNEAVREKKAFAVNTDHCTVYEFLGKWTPMDILSFHDNVFYQEHLTNVLRYKRKKPVRKCRDEIPLRRKPQNTQMNLFYNPWVRTLRSSEVTGL